MNRTNLQTLSILFILILSGCGYRFVDPFPASDYSLESVRNTTPETGLGELLEEELRKSGGFRDGSPNRLSVAVTGFTDSVDSIGSDGAPVRQKLTMDLFWKVDGAHAGESTFGREEVTRTYRYSGDAVTLDWNRQAAIGLLSETAARRLLQRLGDRP